MQLFKPLVTQRYKFYTSNWISSLCLTLNDYISINPRHLLHLSLGIGLGSGRF